VKAGTRALGSFPRRVVEGDCGAVVVVAGIVVVVDVAGIVVVVVVAGIVVVVDVVVAT
jgi:hypothetical protein